MKSWVPTRAGSAEREQKLVCFHGVLADSPQLVATAIGVTS